MNLSKSTITWGVVAVVILLLLVGGCSNYNSIVTLDENCDKSWAKVESDYQMRFDKIPNLVETVKGAAAHEENTFENVTRARAGLSEAYNNAGELKDLDLNNQENFDRYNQAQSELNRQFSIYVNAVKEAYPQLQANENFLSLQDEISGIENRINTSRKDYTNDVQAYNVKIRRFPGSIVASICGFDKRPQFKAEEGASKAPKVSF